MYRNVLLSILIATTLSPALQAEPTPTPQSHLLLPYFEVSLDGLERMTFVSIVNASSEDLDLTARIYTNWAISVHEVEISLKAKAVLQVDLHDWIVAGKLAKEGSVCPGGETDCLDLLHIQTALAGEPSAMTDLYYGSELEKGVATGFITIQADNGFLPESDVLWGDYFYTDPVENFAQGQRLVRREPNLACADLCYRHSIRFLEGGAFASGGTRLTIWNWDGLENRPSADPEPPFALGEAQIDVYSQEGELMKVVTQVKTLPVQPILVKDLAIDQKFGWFDLTTLELSSISGYYRALDRFSVGVPSWCLPCDPCNALGPCYEPNNRHCRPPRDPATLTLIKTVDNTAGGTATVADFDLFVAGRKVDSGVATLLERGSYRASEQTLPNYVPGPWGGDCAENGSVSLAAGEHKVCTITNTYMPDPPRLTLTKIVEGGTATVADFPLFVDETQVTSGAPTEFAPGTYTASERPLIGTYTADPAGWGGDCASDGTVTLEPGDDKECTIINRPTPNEPSFLTLVKTVINDDGGTATVTDFVLSLAGPSPQTMPSGVKRNLPAGDYVASEQNLPGYEAGAWSGDCDAAGNVTLEPGDDKTCRITNDDKPAGIRIEKSTNGHDANTAPGPTLEIGDAITWTYVVTNTGDIKIDNIVVTDDQGVTVSCPKTSLNSGKSMTCTGSGTVTEGPACDGQYFNVGAAVGQAAGEPVEDSDPSHYFCEPDPKIRIEKSTNGHDADTAPGPTLEIGDALTWHYLVTNMGDVTLYDVVVTDDQGVAVSCPKNTLVPDESMTCTGHGTVTEGPACDGQYSNVGAAVGEAFNGDTTDDTDRSHYYCEPPPECGACEGKVSELTMQYLGGVANAFIEVVQKKDGALAFAGIVQPGGIFSFVGLDKKGTLSTEISIFVNGNLNTRIHTSCSQPIGPGLVSGDFLVLAGESREGGPLCPL